MFTIFYSWQSDLPSKKTRRFIRECIDEAIDLAQDSGTIEAEREEATTGTTGSPDIVAALFSKIDNCDLFVADISLCYIYDDKDKKRKKYSPNPNVMLELGYAARVLGWHRVICLCNTDFGNECPFDIDHNRRIEYSLNSKNRDLEKSRIAKDIFKNIRDLQEKGPRAKDGMATHILGSYDFKQAKVTKALLPIVIKKQKSYICHNEELIKEAKRLVQKIQNILIGHHETVSSAHTDNCNDPLKSYVHELSQCYIKSEVQVRINNIEAKKEQIFKWTGVDVTDEFFNCGSLTKRIQFLNNAQTLIGGEKEKEKYETIEELFDLLVQLDMRSIFLKTFDGIQYIPLAIQNVSEQTDQNIRIVIHVLEGEIIDPDEHLICEELEGLQGLICRDNDEKFGIGIIDELFFPPEDGIIHAEEPAIKMPCNNFDTPIAYNGMLQYPEKNEIDFKDELEEYIASSHGNDYYEFRIDSLRPGECKWLMQGMLIKPIKDEIKVRYQLHSEHSSGELSGELIWNQTDYYSKSTNKR